MKKAIIIGAGPAGLTAAYELLKRTDVVPIILEKSGEIGGISRTTNYRGNRMDMGPHRFFSKSDRVMSWWLNIMPLQPGSDEALTISYQNKKRQVQSENSTHTKENPDKVLLVIQRLTRIYFLRKFFAYPIQLTLDTLKTLGLARTTRILVSFLIVRLFPRKPEKSLEDFIVNKFGKELYLLFFKDYTEKVWGVPCQEISAEWGAQRIKGVSLSKAIGQAVKSLGKKNNHSDLAQKNKETSLIEQFLYPKYGPGSLWEEVARQVIEMGGKIYFHQDVINIHHNNGNITQLNTVNSQSGQTGAWEGDYFLSSMPVQELVAGMNAPAPANVQDVAAGLQYRDFINVGILLKQMTEFNKITAEYEKLTLKDNWIYIQERDVKVGRLMIYNNWGDGMVKDPDTTWIGMEYFCNKTDDIWAQTDESIQRLAISELQKMGLARVEDVLDATVRRMEKTYPAYFGTYDRFEEIKTYINQFTNLFLVGRNGMHKYNNADHSMLTAMVAVDNIKEGVLTKENLWSINTEQEYHEVKKEDVPAQSQPDKPANRYKIPHTFGEYLWKTKENKRYAFFALTAFAIQFVGFKMLFPYANYIPDSYSYLTAAAQNLDVNTWPVAYSKFLRIFSAFTHSDIPLVLFQYLLVEIGALYFLFTIFFFYRPSAKVKLGLYLFFIINPIPIFIGNFITADALFIGTSFIWITQLIWIIHHPRRSQVLTHSLLLLVLFTLRYNAIYYPFISFFAILFSHRQWYSKIAAIGLSSALILCSIYITSSKMYRATGERQFSGFGGWQLANNALYMYGHIKNKKPPKVPDQYTRIDQMTLTHFDTAGVRSLQDTVLDGIYYLWSSRAPLIHYMLDKYKKDSTTPYFKRWGSVAKLYAGYGTYLIEKYPKAFLQHFVLPNSYRYLMPPVEFMGLYNMGFDSVGQLAKSWFEYKSQRITTAHKTLASSIFVVAPVLFLITNILFLIGAVWYGLTFKKYLFKNIRSLSFIGVVVLFWLLNFLFSTLASPVVLRYQLFPMFIFLTFSILLIELADESLVHQHQFESTSNLQ